MIFPFHRRGNGGTGCGFAKVRVHTEIQPREAGARAVGLNEKGERLRVLVGSGEVGHCSLREAGDGLTRGRGCIARWQPGGLPGASPHRGEFFSSQALQLKCWPGVGRALGGTGVEDLQHEFSAGRTV